MEKVDREPCPWRVVEDSGGAFVFGLVGGTIWHSVGGARNAPRGQMMSQSLYRVKARVPMLGGSFAVWGALFSCCDCTFTYIRKKEDPWNAIMSGAATGGILAARAGVKAAGRSALAGGVILAAIEGFNLLLMRVLMPSMEQQAQQAGMPVDKLLPPRDPTRVTYSARATTQGKSLWESSSGSPSPFYTTDSTTNSPASSGFDLGSLIKESEASAQKDSWNSNSTNSNLSQSSEDKESKPFWKLW